MESRPDLFRREVQMVGYMFTFESSRERGSTARFLLVPDAGNWLNPPHFHPDEVVDVRLKAGMTIPLLDRKEASHGSTDLATVDPDAAAA